MNTNNFFLLYKIKNAGIDYCWFKSEDELKEYVYKNKNNIEVKEAIEIISCEEIEI